MSHGTPLSWAIPRGPWETHKSRIAERYGDTSGFVGFELCRIMINWMEVEGVDGEVLDLPDEDTAHTQKTNDFEAPLSAQPKTTVACRIDPETKERFSAFASKYDVTQGVLLGFVLREYYETDAWGRSLETVEGDDATHEEPELEPEPTTRDDKLSVICDRLDNGTGGELLASDVRETIADVAGPSVVDGSNGYLSDVLDRLGYVHHPNSERIYITVDQLEERHDLTPDDPAIDRKPYSELTKDERVEGIKIHLRRERSPKTVREIHADVFGGNGSKSYMRNLMDEVAVSDGFAYATTAGGKKILRPTAAQSGQSNSRGRAYTDGGVIDG